MKKNLLISLLFLSTLSYAQIIYSVDDLNLYSPKLIKTSDGGYLFNTYQSNYTPNSTPIEGVSNYNLMKLDAEGKGRRKK